MPVFVSVTVFAELVPVVMLPKLSEVGFAVINKVAEIPVPDNGTVTEGVGELLVIEREPEKVLAEVGVKLTVNACEPPGDMERGVVKPEKVNPAPVSVAWETVRLAVPGLLMAIV